MEFLANQGFDFNKFVYEGVPLLRASDRDRHLSRMDAGDSAPARPDIPLDKPENRELVDRLIAQVAEWLKVRQPHPRHSSTPDLPCGACTLNASCKQGLCSHTVDSHCGACPLLVPLPEDLWHLLEELEQQDFVCRVRTASCSLGATTATSEPSSTSSWRRSSSGLRSRQASLMRYTCFRHLSSEGVLNQQVRQRMRASGLASARLEMSRTPHHHSHVAHIAPLGSLWSRLLSVWLSAGCR